MGKLAGLNGRKVALHDVHGKTKKLFYESLKYFSLWHNFVVLSFSQGKAFSIKYMDLLLPGHFLEADFRQN